MAEHGKLTYKQACQIRAEYAAGARQVDLSRRYGVSQAAVSAILLMKTHKSEPLSLSERRSNELLQKRRSRLLRQYGLTIEQLNDLKLRTGNRCEICGCKPEDQSPHWRTGGHHLFIDHCHATGKVRGLLCRKCNTAIGLMQDDTNLMLKMIEYVTNGGRTLADEK